MNVLVDTSVWSLNLRRRAAGLNHEEQLVAAELRELIREARVRMIGPIRQELLSGIREQVQYLRLRSFLRAFEDQALTREDYESAAHLGNQCRARGISGSPIDFIICAVALRCGWEIFSRDRDFAEYSNAVSIKLHAPRASAWP